MKLNVSLCTVVVGLLYAVYYLGLSLLHSQCTLHVHSIRSHLNVHWNSLPQEVKEDVHSIRSHLNVHWNSFPREVEEDVDVHEHALIELYPRYGGRFEL